MNTATSHSPMAMDHRTGFLPAPKRGWMHVVKALGSLPWLSALSYSGQSALPYWPT